MLFHFDLLVVVWFEQNTTIKSKLNETKYSCCCCNKREKRNFFMKMILRNNN